MLQSLKLREALEQELKNLEKRKLLPQRTQNLYLALNTAVLIGPYVINNIEKAKMYLRNNNDFYRYKKYLWSWRVISGGFKLISAEHYPTIVSFCSYSTRYSPIYISDIIEAISNKQENPFLEFFEKWRQSNRSVWDLDSVLRFCN